MLNTLDYLAADVKSPSWVQRCPEEKCQGLSHRPLPHFPVIVSNRVTVFTLNKQDTERNNKNSWLDTRDIAAQIKYTVHCHVWQTHANESQVVFSLSMVTRKCRYSQCLSAEYDFTVWLLWLNSHLLTTVDIYS